MRQLGNGLSAVHHDEDALAVQEAELSMLRRLGASPEHIFSVQHNLAITYTSLRRYEDALRLKRDVYSGVLKIKGNQHKETLRAANNYAVSLRDLRRFAEARSLLLKAMPVARRVIGESHETALRMRKVYAQTLYQDPAATLGDLSEAVTTLAEIERTARRVLGVSHPITTGIEGELRKARDALHAREGDDVSSVCDRVAAMTPGDA